MSDSESSDEEGLDAMIAAVEAKKAVAKDEDDQQEDTDKSSVSAALAELSSADGGEKIYKVKNKTLKGKKVVVPGKKGKHTVSTEVTLSVGAMGVKLMDGDVVIASYLLQTLASWESVGDTLRIGQNTKTWIEFHTTEGSEICEAILQAAKALVKQKKVDMEAEKQQQKAAAARRTQSGSRTFSVKQSFFAKKFEGYKVPEDLEMHVGEDGIKLTAQVDSMTRVVTIIDIQAVLSWETLPDKATFRLSVKPKALSHDPGYQGQIDFATDEPDAIKEVLLDVAKVMAIQRKEQRQAQKDEAQQQKEKEKLLEKLLENTTAEHCLELCADDSVKETDQVSAPFAAFDAQLRWLKQHVPTAFGRWATSIKAAPTTAESLKQLLLQLAWTAPKGTLSPAETAMLTEMLTESHAEKSHSNEVIQAGALAFVALCTVPANREAALSEGAVELALSWLTQPTMTQADTAPCRAVLQMLLALTRGDADTSIADIVAEPVPLTEAILAVIVDHTQAAPGDAAVSDTAAPATTELRCDNPGLVSASMDVLEKGMQVLQPLARHCAEVRELLSGSDSVAAILGALQNRSGTQEPSAQLYSAAFSGLLSCLLEPSVVDGEELETEGAREARLAAMVEAGLINTALGALRRRLTSGAVASVASTLLRVLGSSAHRDAAIGSLQEDDESSTGHCQPLQCVLAALRQACLRPLEPLAVSLLLLVLGQYGGAAQEMAVSNEALQTVVELMDAYSGERIAQESALIAIHMLTNGLPDDVHALLPTYMGLSAEALQAKGDTVVKYRVVRKAALRKGFELSSKQNGVVDVGEVIDVCEHRVNHLGQTRVRLIRKDAISPLVQYWTSVEARDGGTLLQREVDESTKLKIERKALAMMQTVIKPLVSFPDDESTAEAVMYAASALINNPMLKEAVCMGEPSCLQWLVEALSTHADVAGVAIHGCRALSVLVADSKSVQRTLRSLDGGTTVASALCKILEIHPKSQKVVSATFSAMEAMSIPGNIGQRTFLNKLVEEDSLHIIDGVLKEHKGSNQEILDLGLTIRTKVSKAEAKKKPSTPKGSAAGAGGLEAGRLGPGRRASLSIFAQPAEPPPSPSARTGTGLESVDEEAEEEEEEADDAFELLNNMMKEEMFEIRQTHIKGAGKQVQLQVGSMGLTFYDKNMKPLDNILYQSLLSWKATSKNVTLQLASIEKATDAKAKKEKKTKGNRMIVLKTDIGQEIVKRMESKATELALEYRMRKKFGVTQSHLSDSPPDLDLRVEGKFIHLQDGDTVVQEIAIDSLASFNLSVAGSTGVSDSAELQLVFKDGGGEVILKSEKGKAIIDALRIRSDELTKAAAPEEGIPPQGSAGDEDATANTAAEPEAEAEPEPEPQAAAEPADDDIEVELQSAPTLELKDSYPAVQLEADVVLSAGSEGMVVVVAEEAETQLLYPYGCITSWYLGPHDPSADEDGRALRVCLRVSAGLDEAFEREHTFQMQSSADATAMCVQLEAKACEVARVQINAKLPGAATSTVADQAFSAAKATELVVQLQAAELAAEEEKTASHSAGTNAATGSGRDAKATAAPESAMNVETMEALKETRAELQATKQRLAAAREALLQQDQKWSKTSTERNARIVELEQQLTLQTRAASSTDTAVAEAEAAVRQQMDDAIQKKSAELAGWKQKAESAQALVQRLQKADGSEGGSDGNVIAEMSAEADKLRLQVEKLTVNGKKAMQQLQAKVKESKLAQAEMAKMKKQREKETALVKRAMGELKNLREQIAAKDKAIAAQKAQMKKMKSAVQAMKAKHAAEVEKLALKAEVVSEEA